MLVGALPRLSGALALVPAGRRGVCVRTPSGRVRPCGCPASPAAQRGARQVSWEQAGCPEGCLLGPTASPPAQLAKAALGAWEQAVGAAVLPGCCGAAGVLRSRWSCRRDAALRCSSPTSGRVHPAALLCSGWVGEAPRFGGMLLPCVRLALGAAATTERMCVCLS